MQIDWREHHGSHFENARVLVTGGAGFIGSHLCEALLTLGAHVVALDDLSGGDPDNLQPFGARWGEKLRFVEGTILDAEALSRCADGCRYVFHKAALGSVPASIEQPRRYTHVNVSGTLEVLEAARAAGVERVTYAASSSAYGDAPTLPKIETMPPAPLSPYAASKLAGEGLMSAYSASYGLDTVSLRYFNIFGARQNANIAYAAVIAAFAKAIHHDEPPTIYGDGTQSRDFTHVSNAVHANLLAARRPDPLAGTVINVACGQKITVDELARRMIEKSGRPQLTPEYKEPRAGDVKHSLADLDRARSKLGYEPIVAFAPGLDTTLESFGQVMRPRA